VTERFTLLSELGRGGMGVVWKARDEETGQIVALKLLREAYADDPDYVARFERELELAKRIHSDHVVQVLGFGVRKKTPYLALEYVDGPSLHDAQAQHGAYTWLEARALLVQIAQGLADAHTAGVIHRDVKPSNVLIGTDGVAKLTDFGIARGLDLTRMTATSTMLGTPAYLAPEGPVDTRSDLYSLGIIGFELLTGSPPFVGSTFQQIILAHVRTPPDLEKLPPEARPVLGWLLTKGAEDRPQNAQELLAVLRGRLMLPGMAAPGASHGTLASPMRPVQEPASSVQEPVAGHLLPDGALDQRAHYGGDGSGRSRAQSAIKWRDAGGFTRGASMNTPRLWHAATLLADGRVLLTGGWNGTGATTRTEAFDPASGSISRLGPMVSARTDHTATSLMDGMVLIVGGCDNPISLASAEVHNPTTGTFSPVANMTIARQSHTATLLPDGRVLIVGGYAHRDSSPIAEIESFDASTGTFAPVGELSIPRSGHAMTLMSDGRVLITGGRAKGRLADTAELYDPRTQETVLVGRLTKPRRNHIAVLLPDGRVLIAGGMDTAGTPLASVEIYVPGTVGLAAIAPLSEPRSGHTATVLPDGRVLIVGGRGPEGPTRSTELFYQDSNSFVPDASMMIARESHTATLLSNGRVLIAGGQGQGGVLDSTEVYSQ
jgi:hypothetical protein